MLYQHAAVGGTFDHFHDGHKSILNFAFHTARCVTIGVVGDKPIDIKQFPNILEAFNIRKKSVVSYILQNKWVSRSSIIELHDIYGTATKEPLFDSIVVTKETKSNAKKINERRQQNKLKPLEIVIIPLLKGCDNKIIRSTRIRKGTINRTGYPYAHLFTKSKALHLPHHLRDFLRKPLGQIIEGEDQFASFTAQKTSQIIKHQKPFMIISVGDIVSNSLQKAKVKLDIIIIDYRSRRKDLSYKPKTNINYILNPPGTIQKEAVNNIKTALDCMLKNKTSQKIVIKGEEDLLALPAIMFAPLESIVVYGQKDFGIVIVKVTEHMKLKVAGIIQQFE